MAKKMNPLAKMLIPLVKQHLTEEKATEVYDIITGTTPVLEGATHNVVILTKRSDEVYICVASVDDDNNIIGITASEPLVKLVHKLLEQ